MSLHDPLFPEHFTRSNPGAATVADIRTLDGFQSLTIMMLRDWFDGPAGRTRVEQVFEGALGQGAGAAGLDAWDEMMTVLSNGVRRPVMRHSLTCQCVGADEAVIAQVIALAARGEREDAMLILSLLVSGERLLPAIQSAERAGRTLMRITLLDRRAVAPNRLH
ncbi:hypothetical protein N9W17_04535 [Jannaschia sp.]|nr:hypothetical protein [Jannaschia sp.]